MALATEPLPTRIFSGGAILSMVPGGAPPEAVVTKLGRIDYVGTEAEAESVAGPDAERVDLGGRALVPGFIDAHHHFGMAAVYRGAIGLRRPEAQSIEGWLSLYRDAAAKTPPGAWILGQGYDEALIRERRVPTRDEFDAACPDHPALAVQYSVHEGVTNSRGLAIAGFTGDRRPPVGGELGEDRRGRRNGQLIEAALGVVEAIARADLLQRSAAQLMSRMVEYERELFAVGITRVADAGVDPAAEVLYRAAVAEGTLKLPVVMMPIGSAGLFLPPTDRLDGGVTGEGDDSLLVGPLKLFFDGAGRCAMCLSFREMLTTTIRLGVLAARARSWSPIADARHTAPRRGPKFTLETGVKFYSPEDGQRIARDAAERGFAVAIHAIGNAAVDDAVNALSAIRSVHVDSHPPRIEHGTIMSVVAARKIADQGIAVVAQPDFVRLPVYESMPKIRGVVFNGLKTMLDAGILVAGSSDAPVASPAPLDAIRSAVRRLSHHGRTIQPEERVGVMDALAMYTRNAAAVCGVSGQTGTIEVGKRADLVVLSGDPVTASHDALDGLAVEQTYLAGERVYAVDA